MHREISHADQAFHKESNLSLYLLTGLLGLIIGLDLWPRLAGWTPSVGSHPAHLAARNRRLPDRPAGRRAGRAPRPVRLPGSVFSKDGWAPTSPSPSPASPPSSSASRSSPPRSSSSAWSASAWKASPSSARSGPSAHRRGLPAPLLAAARRPGSARPHQRSAGRRPRRRQARCPRAGRRRGPRGPSAVDAGALTGESLPVDKGPGDEVLAGSLNQFGALTIEARRVGRAHRRRPRHRADRPRPQGQGAAGAHRRPAGPLLPAGRPGLGRR